MIFWIIQAQENPSETSDKNVTKREWRSNAISEALKLAGHDVIRWRSSFSHQKKIQLSTDSSAVRSNNYLLQYIKASSYRRHVGLARIRSHRSLASNFLKLANDTKKFPILYMLAMFQLNCAQPLLALVAQMEYLLL